MLRIICGKNLIFHLSTRHQISHHVLNLRERENATEDHLLRHTHTTESIFVVFVCKMANSFLLPYHYQQAKAAKPRPARQWLSMFNEKHLILLLLVISIVTIFVILMNLPPDLQRAVRRESHHVFMPEVDYRAVKGSGDQLTHRDDHQHPAPPLYPDDKPKLEPSSSDTTSTPPSSQSTVVMSPLAAKNEYELNVTAKRNKIKEVKLKYSVNQTVTN